MGNRYEDVINSLNYQELMRLKRDIDNGALNTKRILEEKVKKRLREHEKTCAICTSTLNFYSTNNYTLLFGPDDSKKKASFCGLDCMGYFINKLKDMKSEKQEESSKANRSLNQNI